MGKLTILATLVVLSALGYFSYIYLEPYLAPIVQPYLDSPYSVTEDENVLVLTNNNFNNVVANYSNVLVKFYAPWCGHCKHMAPEYSRAAAHFHNNPETQNIKLAKIDATVYKDHNSKYGVRGYPSLKFFKNGKVYDYKGGRVEKEII